MIIKPPVPKVNQLAIMSVLRGPGHGDPGDTKRLQAAMSEACLVIHSPPDFPVNAEILGVCGVSVDNSDQNKYGWVVADFLMWKTLFHRVGNPAAQTWLSSLDLPKFLTSVPSTVVGDIAPIKEIVGADNGHVTSIPSEANDFVEAFLKQVTKSARSAAIRKTALVIMVFAPVTPEHDICVDFDGKNVYLTIECLRETIRNAVGEDESPTILVTPSAFTGGWLCRPWFMSRPDCTSSDTMMRIIAKSCGGAFAERFIKNFTQRNSPLLTDAERKKAQYNDLMPIGPTGLQTDLLHRFQRQIHESLEKRLSVLAQNHTLVLPQDDSKTLSSDLDAWTSFAPREGRTMRYWAKQMRSSRPVIDGVNRFEFLGEAFGGSRGSQLFHLRYLAAIELDTCPGDWKKNVNGTTRTLLQDLMQMLNPGEDKVKRVFDAIEFRASSMILVQTIAKAFNLPIPGNIKCRYWNDTTEGVDDDYYRKLQIAFGALCELFCQVPVLPSEMRHDYNFSRFWRAARWLSAAIALKFAQNHSRLDIENFVSQEVAPVFAKIQGTQQILLLNDQAVTRAGLEWLAALGLVEGKTWDTTVPAMGWIPAPVLENKSHNGAAVQATSLDAKAGEFKPKQIDTISAENTQPVVKVKAQEAKRASIDPVPRIADTWGSPAKAKKEHIVQDLLDHFEVQPQPQPVVQEEVEDLLAMEDDKADEPATPSVAAVAPQPAPNEDTERLVRAVLDGTLPGFSNVNLNHLSELIKKAVESKAQAATGGAHFENSAGTQGGLSTAASSTDVTIGHSRVGFFEADINTKMKSLTMNAPTPPRTPGPNRLAGNQFSNKSAENKEHEYLIQISSPQGPAGSNNAAAGAGSFSVQNRLAAGDDFWTRAGIQW